MSGAPIGVAGPVLSAAERNARNNGYIRAASYAAVGALELFAGLLRVPADQVTVYKLVFDDAAVKLSDLTLPVGGMYVAAGLVSLLMAGLQLRRPTEPAWRRLLAVVAFVGIAAVLTGILGGKQPSLVGLLLATVSFSLPIVFAGLSAILAERSGMYNIGIEGIILLGACATSIGGSLLGNPIAGVAVGVRRGSSSVSCWRSCASATRSTRSSPGRC